MIASSISPHPAPASRVLKHLLFNILGIHLAEPVERHCLCFVDLLWIDHALLLCQAGHGNCGIRLDPCLVVGGGWGRWLLRLSLLVYLGRRGVKLRDRFRTTTTFFALRGAPSLPHRASARA